MFSWFEKEDMFCDNDKELKHYLQVLFCKNNFLLYEATKPLLHN